MALFVLPIVFHRPSNMTCYKTMLPTTTAIYVRTYTRTRTHTHTRCNRGNRNTSKRAIKPATGEMILETYTYFTTPIYDGNWV